MDSHTLLKMLNGNEFVKNDRVRVISPYCQKHEGIVLGYKEVKGVNFVLLDNYGLYTEEEIERIT